LRKQENLVDTLHMIMTTPSVSILLAADMAALALFNIGGMTITASLDPLFLTLLEALRTVMVCDTNQPSHIQQN
jgi:hypothetical protein